MYFLFYILSAVFFFRFEATATRKIPRETLTSWSKSRYVDHANDILSLHGLRLFTIGLIAPQFQSVFESDGVSLAFGSRDKSIVRGHWSFGETKVLELTPSSTWEEAQIQEFDLRIRARVQWASVMKDAGWWNNALMGWIYDYDATTHSDSLPFAVVVDDVTETLSVRLRDILQKAHMPVLSWSTSQTNFASQLKALVIQSARLKEMNRVKEEAYNRGVQTRSQQLEYEKGKMQAQVQEKIKDAFKKGREKGISEAQRECQSHSMNYHVCENDSPVNEESLVAELCSLVRDHVFDMSIMKKPLLSTRSGQSFEAENVRKWVREKGTDPTNRAQMDVKDLVENRHLQSLIEVIKPFCGDE